MRRILALCVLLFLIFPLSRTARAEEIPFREGDRIVIWHPDSEAALSGTEESCDVFLDQGILTGFSQPEIWTLSQNPDRSWRLEQDGHTLSLGDDYDYLTFSGPHSGWRFIPSESGLYRIENTGRDQCLCLNARRRTWTTCGLTETRAGHTEFALYLLPREEEGTPILPPEMPEGYRLYFGALHAHTDLSDGEGTVEEAFQYASQVEGLDFFAVTDHSHSFDNGKSATLDASPDSTAWHRGKAAAQAVTDTDFVGIFGFEMTWNQGQGHMNTFATPGFLSRETDASQSYATGMEAYFHALTEVPQSISQFNHPGLQYGDFKDFSGYTPKLDRQISLIEVESDTRYYDRALRLGWQHPPGGGTLPLRRRKLGPAAS